MDRQGAQPSERLLERFGVSAEAESIWRVLMVDPEASTDLLSRQTGLSSIDVATALGVLEDAQLVRGASVPSGVVTIDPALAVETHIVRIERQMAEQAEALAQLRAQIPQLASDYAGGRKAAGDQPGFEIVERLEDVRRQVDLAGERVKADIRSMEHRPLGVGLVHNRAIQDGVFERGVRDRLIMSTQGLHEPGVLAHYEELERQGHRLRALPNVETRLLLYDCDLAVLPIDPTDPSLGAIFIRVPTVIDMLILMYDHMWSVATPVFTKSVEAEGLAGRRAQILELLALGTKDERIARTIGIGVRTVRREIADLKAVLGVSSRAEIAAAAIRKGWL
jgi:DNA-binding CsgD family transcriptional regulator